MRKGVYQRSRVVPCDCAVACGWIHRVPRGRPIYYIAGRPVSRRIFEAAAARARHAAVGFLLAALLLAGCASGEQGRSTTPAAGFTVHADRGSTVYILIHGDANAKGTAAPENAASGQAVTGPDIKTDATVPLR